MTTVSHAPAHCIDRPDVTPAEDAAMAEAFGWDRGDDIEAHYAAWQCQQEELVRKFSGLQDAPDALLEGIVANPPGLMGDCAEVVEVARILLDRRAAGITPRV